ncbi:TetR/AcrR family transcriptional regulator [Methylobacillus gramineus]|uniref:TetR/AcrR family transcriptional regulator n=1 Tax=Methylobacillus gramineus TaxID=755169 RepID=UPI001CFF59A7|nr:TetR/AcrR family transcriptional regulator [Methylobacillus gramineus]MCB5184784.1 TetR/AcrR family transcriptional regulator [Methylobacillus gramineus]
MSVKAAGGRPTKEASELLGQHMLEIAAQTFLDKGFQGASIEGIAKAAGVSKLTIYRHFETKNSLFIAVIRKYMDIYVSALVEATNTKKPPAEALFDIGLFISDQWFKSNNIKLSRILIAEVHRIEGLSAMIDQALNEGRIPVEHYLLQLMDRGLVSFTDVRAATIQFVQLCVSGHYFLLRDESVIPDDEGRARLVRSAVNLFMYGHFLKPATAG